MKLLTPDGAEMDEAEVNRQFAESMAAPEPEEPIAPAPEPADVDAPEQPAPREKRSHTKARTAPGAPGAPGGGRRGRGRPRKVAAAPAPLPEGTFTGPVVEFLEALSIAGALVPLPDGELRTKVRVQAAMVEQHAGGLATAIDGAARHNATIRRGVEAITQGSAGWVLPAVMAVAPFAAQTLGLWKSPVNEDMMFAADTFEAATRAKIMTAMGQQGEDASATA